MNPDFLAELKALVDIWERCAAINESALDDYRRNGDSLSVMVSCTRASTERSDARELREILDRYAPGSGVAEGGV
jgi:hypothetical protein